jgi:hypothetical protein
VSGGGGGGGGGDGFWEEERRKEEGGGGKCWDALPATRGPPLWHAYRIRDDAVNRAPRCCAQGKYSTEVAALQSALRSREDRVSSLEMDVAGLQARADSAGAAAAALSDQVSSLTLALERSKVRRWAWSGGLASPPLTPVTPFCFAHRGAQNPSHARPLPRA